MVNCLNKQKGTQNSRYSLIRRESDITRKGHKRGFRGTDNALFFFKLDGGYLGIFF